MFSAEVTQKFASACQLGRPQDVCFKQYLGNKFICHVHIHKSIHNEIKGHSSLEDALLILKYIKKMSSVYRQNTYSEGASLDEIICLFLQLYSLIACSKKSLLFIFFFPCFSISYFYHTWLSHGSITFHLFQRLTDFG